MSSIMHYQAIPTNIITGFLGVGKTTAIQYLLRTQSERWAILVNEFGEIGIDGRLLESDSSISESVVIKEVPGGCLCCAAGVPMKVALNQLIKQAKPTRLLIEPTGLGHPSEIISTLTQSPYQAMLDLRATLTFVDARKIQDQRYTEHEIFQQQLQVADVIVAHKADTYHADDFIALQTYLVRLQLATTPLYPVTYGQIKSEWLNLPRQALFALTHFHPPITAELETESLQLATEGYLHKSNEGEGFISQGWLFAPSYVFIYAKLCALFQRLSVVRLKAVVITDKGTMAVNQVDAEYSGLLVNDAQESRIEILNFADSTPFINLETELLACLV